MRGEIGLKIETTALSCVRNPNPLHYLFTEIHQNSEIINQNEFLSISSVCRSFSCDAHSCVISGFCAVNTAASFHIPVTKSISKHCFDSVTDIHHRLSVLENTSSSFDKGTNSFFYIIKKTKNWALLCVCVRPGAICVPIQPESIHLLDAVAPRYAIGTSYTRGMPSR
jgi:hypothetical protein